MSTVINVTLHCYPHNNDKMVEFITHCCNTNNAKARLSEYVEKNSCPRKIFKLEVEDQGKIKDIIHALNLHKDDPLLDFKEIEAYDYTIGLEADDINPLSEFLRLENERSKDVQFQLLDFVMCDMIDEQQTMKERITAVEEYLTKSGVIYYKQFMEVLISLLSDAGIIDPKVAHQRMFKVVH